MCTCIPCILKVSHHIPIKLCLEMVQENQKVLLHVGTLCCIDGFLEGHISVAITPHFVIAF